MFNDMILEPSKYISIKLTFSDGSVLEKEHIYNVTKSFKGELLKTIIQTCDIKIDNIVDVRNKEVKIEFGIKLEEEQAYEYINWGTFIVDNDSIIKDVETNTVSFSAYDRLYNAHMRFEPNSIEYPINVGGLLEKLCNDLNLTLITSAFSNAYVIIKENVFISNENNYTYRDILDEIACIAGGNIIVIDDFLYVKYPHDINYEITKTNVKNMKFYDRYKINALSVPIVTQTDDGEQVETKEVNDGTSGDQTKIEISNNLLLNAQYNDLYLNLFNELLNIDFYPFELETFGFCFFMPCDVVTIDDEMGNPKKCLILQNTINVTSGLSETISFEAPQSNTNNFSVSGHSSESVFDASTQAHFQMLDSKVKLINSNIDITNSAFKIENGKVTGLDSAVLKSVFTDSAIIKNLTVSESGTFLGELNGVTINGDLITANTLKADRLLLQGKDGLYYQLNLEALGEEVVATKEEYKSKLDGSAIVTNSIKANKIDVQNLSSINSDLGDIKGGSININNNFIVSSKGELIANNVTLKGSETVTVYEKNEEYSHGLTRTFSLNLMKDTDNLFSLYSNGSFRLFKDEQDDLTKSYKLIDFKPYRISVEEHDEDDLTVKEYEYYHGQLSTPDLCVTGDLSFVPKGFVPVGEAYDYLDPIAQLTTTTGGISFSTMKLDLDLVSADIYMEDENLPITINNGDLALKHVHYNTNKAIGFGVGSGGDNRGIYDYTTSRWICRYDSSGDFNVDKKNGNPLFKVYTSATQTSNNSVQILMDGTNRQILRPSANNTGALGTTGYRWNEIFGKTITGTNAFVKSSDLKLKEIISNDLSKSKDFIMSLNPISYYRKDMNDNKIHLGFGAQDVYKSIKETFGDDKYSIYNAKVRINSESDSQIDWDEKPLDDSKIEWSLSYDDFIAPTIKVVQENTNDIEVLQKENKQLKDEIYLLNQKVESLLNKGE